MRIESNSLFFFNLKQPILQGCQGIIEQIILSPFLFFAIVFQQHSLFHPFRSIRAYSRFYHGNIYHPDVVQHNICVLYISDQLNGRQGNCKSFFIEKSLFAPKYFSIRVILQSDNTTLKSD